MKVLFQSLLYFNDSIKSKMIIFLGIEMPENPKPSYFDRVPIFPPGVRPPKMQKRLKYMRGREPVHNTLIHKQYGIVVRTIIWQ